jgi:hypothetical protein
MHHFVTFILEKMVTWVIITEGYNLDRVTVNLQEVALHKEDKEPADYGKEMTVTSHTETNCRAQEIRSGVKTSEI